MNTRSIQRNVLRNRCIIPTRTHRLGFSTSTTFYLLNRSPKVRDNEWRRQKEFEKKSKPPPIRSTRDSESAWTKWPVDILRSAAKSGKLSISWEAAKAILDDFHGLKSQSWESLCSSTVSVTEWSFVC